MTSTLEENLVKLNKSLEGVNVSAPSTTKFSRLEESVAEILQLPREDVVASTISKPGNFTVRVMQSDRAQKAQLFVCVLPSVADVEATRVAVTHFMEHEGRPSNVVFVVNHGSRVPGGLGWTGGLPTRVHWRT